MNLIQYYKDNVSQSWREVLDKLNYQELLFYIEKEYDFNDLLPNRMIDVLAPFIYTKFEDIKVMMVADSIDISNVFSNGLLYGSYQGISNQSAVMFRELRLEYLTEIERVNGSLKDWAKQGVLLINATPITKSNEIGYYTEMFTEFTKSLIEYFEKKPKIVFVYLGYWKTRTNRNVPLISNNDSDILGSGLFLGIHDKDVLDVEGINDTLIKLNIEPVDWLKIKRENPIYDIRKFMEKARRNRKEG